MLIVGLGNPGSAYARTRHNVGWMLIDRLAERLNVIDWKAERDVEWIKAGQHWMIKPQAFMNRSGQALMDFFRYKHLPHTAADLAQQFLVVHDEVDFPAGQYKIQSGRSSAGHNGVQSIIDIFGTQEFQRLRFGVGDNRAQGLPSETYVLQTFRAGEWPSISSALDQATAELQTKLA